MRRWIAAALLLAVAGCSGSSPPAGLTVAPDGQSPAGLTVHAGEQSPAGATVLTEAYLQQQADLAWCQQAGWVLAELMADRGLGYDSMRLSEDWAHNPGCTFNLHGWGGSVWRTPVTVRFGGADYAGGAVTQHNCHQLPGSGTVMTGKVDTIHNQGEDPETHEIEQSVEESHSREVTLDETLETKSGLTVEADSPVGVKAGASLETTFGFAKGSATSDETKRAYVLKDSTEIPAGRTVAFTSSTDDAATRCDIDLSAARDYKDIAVHFRIVFHGDAGAFWLPCEIGNQQAQARGGGQPGFWKFVGHESDHDGFGCSATFADAENLVEVANCVDERYTRLQGCGFAFSARAARALKAISDPGLRHVSFAGERRAASASNASLWVLDVTGMEDCARDALDDPGAAIDDVLDETRTKLLACTP